MSDCNCEKQDRYANCCMRKLAEQERDTANAAYRVLGATEGMIRKGLIEENARLRAALEEIIHLETNGEYRATSQGIVDLRSILNTAREALAPRSSSDSESRKAPSKAAHEPGEKK